MQDNVSFLHGKLEVFESSEGKSKFSFNFYLVDELERNVSKLKSLLISLRQDLSVIKLQRGTSGQ